MQGFAAEVDANIGRNLRTAREARGISQAELARLVGEMGVPGFHQTTIARIENGARPLRAAEAIAVCRVLEVTLEYLAESAASASLRNYRRSLEESVQAFRAATDQLVYSRWNVAFELDRRVPYGPDGVASQETILRANVEPGLYEILEERLVEASPIDIVREAYFRELHSGRAGYQALAESGSKTRLNFLFDEMTDAEAEIAVSAEGTNQVRTSETGSTEASLAAFNAWLSSLDPQARSEVFDYLTDEVAPAVRAFRRDMDAAAENPLQHTIRTDEVDHGKRQTAD